MEVLGGCSLGVLVQLLLLVLLTQVLSDAGGDMRIFARLAGGGAFLREGLTLSTQLEQTKTLKFNSTPGSLSVLHPEVSLILT